MKDQEATRVDSPTTSDIEHMLDRLIELGELNETTGRAMKTSTRKVLQFHGVSPDEPVTDDVADAAARRFEREAEDFTEGSRRTYTSRLVKALRLWDDTQQHGYPTPGSDSLLIVTGQNERAVDAPSSGRQPEQPSAPPPATTTEVIEVPVVLRRDLLVRIPLPIDLTRHEAERLASVIAAQVIETAR